ncbi:hypothetical protein IMZ48_47885 [Candidatus Bathyarchaeota archaeon]|nr:hypothetical protein [Candidatus Bathyarchaeota archaeon]
MTNSNAPKATATDANKKKGKEAAAPPKVEEKGEEAGISGAPAAPVGHEIIGQEERVEFRDQDGKLLSEEEVKELEGKVEFKTRYETRTRVVDADGNELYVDIEEGDVEVAPPHPDVEGVDPNTRKGKGGDEEGGEEVDGVKEAEAAESVEGEREGSGKVARPGSEVDEATQGREEL